MCACCAGGSGGGNCSGAIPDPWRFEEKRYESRKLRVVDSSTAGARSIFGGEFDNGAATKFEFEEYDGSGDAETRDEIGSCIRSDDISDAWGGGGSSFCREIC